jgi:hypothetical protein
MKVTLYPKHIDAVRKMKQIEARNDLDFILTSWIGHPVPSAGATGQAD